MSLRDSFCFSGDILRTIRQNTERKKQNDDWNHCSLKDGLIDFSFQTQITRMGV
jgi:hypothetical protein